MQVKEEKKKKAEYMREYTRNNKAKINSDRKIRRDARKLESSEFRDMANVRQKKYYEKNKEKIAEYHKNIPYDPVKGKEVRERSHKKNPFRAPITNAKARAKKKDLDFDLTHEWYKEQFEKGCEVTGLELQGWGSKCAKTAHIDRIVPELGYIMSNCRLVTASYNLAKKDWTDADVLEMAAALVNKI